MPSKQICVRSQNPVDRSKVEEGDCCGTSIASPIRQRYYGSNSIQQSAGVPSFQSFDVAQTDRLISLRIDSIYILCIKPSLIPLCCWSYNGLGSRLRLPGVYCTTCKFGQCYGEAFAQYKPPDICFPSSLPTTSHHALSRFSSNITSACSLAHVRDIRASTQLFRHRCQYPSR